MIELATKSFNDGNGNYPPKTPSGSEIDFTATESQAVESSTTKQDQDNKNYSVNCRL